MKHFLLIGGFCGFLIVFATGVAAGNNLTFVLRNATIGCLCGALLLRGFRLLLSHQLRQAVAVEAESSAAPIAATADRK